jgi:tetratricopeptide (TPR) repeat protein
VEGRIAYGSFLSEGGEEHLAAEQWEKARLLDPNNPAPWNNLANYHGHHGPVTNSFVYYEKAIQLNPNEPVYYQNFATTVYLFRTDARAHYGIEEQQVFDKALGLYRKALELSPDSFPIASDLAQTYYGIKPFRLADAIAAWQSAFKLAQSEDEKQGVYVHFARLNIRARDYPAATNHLERVTLPQYAPLKERLYRLIGQQQAEKTEGGATPPAAGTDSPK